ncbi:MAG: hypothetical protein AAF402_12630, partial [Pseudomonadota bacterium]
MRYFLLDDLLKALKAKRPESLLLSALFPLNSQTNDLEKNASTHYRSITLADSAKKEDRDVLAKVFLHLLFQRFKTKTT